MKYTKLFILILVTMTGLSTTKAELEQDYRIAFDGDHYTVYGVIDGKPIFNSVEAYEAIQYAIEGLADRGGQVIISRGDFPLDKPIRLKDRIHLLGSGRASRLLVSEKNSEGIGVICEKLNGIIISNLSFTAGDNPEARMGILIDDCGDSKVQDVFSVGFAEYGISVRNNSFLNVIDGCHLAGNKKANLHLQELAKGRYGDFIPNLVSNCVIYGGGKGIEMNRVIVLNIVGCIIYQTGDAAFHLHSRSNSVLITGCRTFQITGPAVLVEGSHEFNCSSNIFCWHTEQGILLRSVNWGTITGNEIIDSGSYNSGEKDRDTPLEAMPADQPLYDGIELINVHGYHVGGNTIFNWQVAPLMRNGISEDSQSGKNIIIGNNINYYSEEDVLSKGKETTVQGNVSLKEEAHERLVDTKLWLQSFKTEWMDQYIDIQKK